MQEPENVVAVLLDVIALDLRVSIGALFHEIDEGAGLEWYEQCLVQNMNAINRAPRGDQGGMVVLVQEDCGQADGGIGIRRDGKVISIVQARCVGAPGKSSSMNG